MAGEFRITVADDDAALLKVLQSGLRSAGYQVEAYAHGGAALEALRSNPPHVAVLDHYMPGKTGREICQELRAEGSRVRIILLTTADKVVDRVSGLDAGADDYLTKPYDLDELLARVRAQLRHLTPAPSALLLEGLQSADPTRRRQAIEQVAARPGGLHFRVLGDFRIRHGGVDVEGAVFNRRKPRALLKMLLASYDRVVQTDRLIDALWSDLPLTAARRNMHVCVQRLRSALAPFGQDRVETTPAGYLLRLGAEDTLDLREFDALALALANARGDALHRVEDLIRLYAGELFADEPYAEWAAPLRERVHTTFVDVLGRAAVLLRKSGDHDRAARVLRHLVDLESSNEERAADLAECLIDMGDMTGAREVLTRAEKALETDLGVTPNDRLRALQARLETSLPD